MIAHVRLPGKLARQVDEIRVALGQARGLAGPVSTSEAIRWAVRRAHRGLTKRGGRR